MLAPARSSRPRSSQVASPSRASSGARTGTRPAARLAPGTRELLAELATHMYTVADEFDRSR